MGDKIRCDYGKCKEFFNNLAAALADTYEVVPSPYSRDLYLVPKGTSDQISFEGKPQKSFRLSDHWNWRGKDDERVQCYNVNLPNPRRRKVEGEKIRPILARQVAFYGRDNKYYAVYGEIYDKRSGKWSVIEWDLEDALYLL